MVILKNIGKFTGKNLRSDLFFNKIAVLWFANLFEKKLPHSCFPVNFAKFLRRLF